MNSISNVTPNSVAFNGRTKFNLKNLWSKKNVTNPATIATTGAAVTAGTALASLGVTQKTKSVESAALSPSERAKIENVIKEIKAFLAREEAREALESKTPGYYQRRGSENERLRQNVSDDIFD